MRPLKSIEEFFQSSPLPEQFIRNYRDEIIDHLDERAFQRAYLGKFKYFLIFYPLAVGTLNYGKSGDLVTLVYWSLFSLATAITIRVGSRRKSALNVKSAKYFLEFVTGLSIVLTAILSGHVESMGLVTRGGPIQFSFIIQAANPYWFDREKLVLRGLVYGIMSYFFAAHFFPDFYTILISQVLIGVPASIFVTLALHSGEVAQVNIKALADKEKEALEIDRTHGWRQLSRLIYPHQHHLLKIGHVLEETMNLERKEAIVSEFDIKDSASIVQIPGYDLHKGNLFKNISQEYIFRNYKFSQGWEDLRTPLSDGYFFKDTGDGFIYTVGHPFRSEHPNHAEQSIKMAFDIIVFSKMYLQTNLGANPFICVAIVRSMVQGLWKSSNVTDFDFTDRSVIPVARLGSFRRELENKGAIKRVSSQILISEDVYVCLVGSKNLFKEIDIVSLGLRLRGSDARYVYVHDVE
ncbi:MAG TPA: hypothetical protein VE954_36720 [Oligoflexus sp.]|uniref:hypothetical protein n=1 Tax=Oligoflexus sp. TaxID=1971216 RepID=UPI002D4D531A|nr:hypothetical protein [Oligoflexus sp.]HYX38681.1 hypothetical protein [Oligoflexus sp.]